MIATCGFDCGHSDYRDVVVFFIFFGAFVFCCVCVGGITYCNVGGAEEMKRRSREQLQKLQENFASMSETASGAAGSLQTPLWGDQLAEPKPDPRAIDPVDPPP